MCVCSSESCGGVCGRFGEEVCGVIVDVGEVCVCVGGCGLVIRRVWVVVDVGEVCVCGGCWGGVCVCVVDVGEVCVCVCGLVIRRVWVVVVVRKCTTHCLIVYYTFSYTWIVRQL